ncbi:MAG: uroporphyrinogen-III C-methyltransferase [Methylobacteriaceae bacterium]|jgi:uroporphyrin-III C-methyltransferase|nr:uroporphyrinogen-III C-methyltransferase [Methylobacteriaceae bacterium]
MTTVEHLIEDIDLGPDIGPGEVWLVGAGPGDPRYLTLEAFHALAQADDIVYDALVDPRTLRLVPRADKHFVGKRCDRHSIAQDDINTLLITLARGNRRVVRLKGGDPFLFGRAAEEVSALRNAGIPVRVLPGLTSSLAALTRAGIPLTLRGVNEALVLVTGHVANNHRQADWRALARIGQPLIIYMGLKNIRHITDELLAGGLAPETDVAVIMSASWPGERVFMTTLEKACEDSIRECFTPPAILAVGKTVALRNRFSV